MMLVAMLVAMLAPTEARPVRAPMLITPARWRRPRVGDEGFGKNSICARGRRARVVRMARAQGRANDVGMRRQRPVWQNSI
eukprot:2150857-Pyramimonas_sp.AAC.1